MKYQGETLKEIIFPLGGIGTGSVGLTGYGGFMDWEICNRPNKGSLNNYSCFAIKAEYPDGRSVTKILQGDLTKDLVGKYSKTIFQGYGYGPSGATMCGLPHFEELIFDGSFPIATLSFRDKDFPATVVLTAFNPLIPHDADNSSIPAAFFRIAVNSHVDGVKYTVIFSVGNLFDSTKNEKIDLEECTAVKMLHAAKDPSDPEYGDMSIAVDRKDGICQTYWYRGDCQDKVTTFWHDLTHGDLADRVYDEPSRGDVASVGAVSRLNAGQSDSFRFVLSWNVPNNYNYWNRYTDGDGKDITWKNYYATLFADSVATAVYAFQHWEALYDKTKRFCDLLHGSTIDSAVIDAVSSTLSVLKSPTVLRLTDGTFYGWEGVHEQSGSCEGTCTHVWSYAYALCFLFPELERSLRMTELYNDTDENGRMQFRTSLPIGRPRGNWHPCLDGQMGTLIKIYRDWKITGDTAWLSAHWDAIKRVLEFAWHPKNEYEWDRDHDGVLEGRQHHTLDMELFGPSSWLQGMYLAALKAASEMADALGDTAKREEYRELFESGYAYVKENLFNGSYFYHKVDLTNRGYIEHFDCPYYWNEEKGQLKYQLGEGCEIDQLLGQWHANIIGLGDIFDKEQRRTALQSMVKHNVKSSLRDFANLWRVFALNDEGGVIICDYPEGAKKPVIPLPYSEECMTGFEYAFAGLLISEGLLEEGLAVVRAIRGRYDGKKRNPWNEIECGSNYARPMASFALLPILSGLTFDLPKGRMGFDPLVTGDFRCLFSLGGAWGEIAKTGTRCMIALSGGTLTLREVLLPKGAVVAGMTVDDADVSFRQEDRRVIFDPRTATEALIFDLI